MRLVPHVLSRRHLLGQTAALLALPLTAGIAWAAPSSGAAERVVQRLVEQVFQVVEAGGGDQVDRRKLLLVIEEQTDLNLLGRLALGRYWRTASADQQSEYLRLFRSFVVQSFVNRVRPFAGHDLGSIDQRFQIVASRPAGKRDVLVHSRILPPNSGPLEVHWRLREGAGEPAIIDAIVEGVSLLVTQRSEFAAVLERAGLDGLLLELRARTESA